MASNVDWSGLLPELVELILDQLTLSEPDRLTRLSNHLHFACVCSSWQSVAINNRSDSHLRQLPLLMLPSSDNTKTRHFFSLSSGRNHGFHIPEIHRKWCCGSSKSWLITVDGSTGGIQLFNPFSRGCIQLPSLSTFTYPQFSFDPKCPRNSHYIHKTVLSANPCRTRDFVVMAIITNWRILAYYKPGADRWITIKTQWACFDDVIHYKGLFYAVSSQGPVVAYDFSSEPPIVTNIIDQPPEQRTCNKYYLAESLGELLLVLRFLRFFNVNNSNGDKEIRIKTVQFKVYKLDESRRQWVQMKSIGDRILFLGCSCSMSLSTEDFPECNSNSIYFNDDCRRGSCEPPFGYHDRGIFNFDNGSVVVPFCKSPPIWTTPSFWVTPDPW
ncbi:hypothetical protein NE237_025594 [Protea cynaroides]|uniref:KIB1-4 beta-propeller domain-containing protein n=1 Tax=Protea cynaroides TaxID=273540 RepID=A0A9Q0H2N0_9MAGN|nr:hypothetical protein NE237_025594 [Protea cynaroides]